MNKNTRRLVAIIMFGVIIIMAYYDHPSEISFEGLCADISNNSTFEHQIIGTWQSTSLSAVRYTFHKDLTGKIEVDESAILQSISDADNIELKQVILFNYKINGAGIEMYDFTPCAGIGLISNRCGKSDTASIRFKQGYLIMGDNMFERRCLW